MRDGIRPESSLQISLARSGVSGPRNYLVLGLMQIIVRESKGVEPFATWAVTRSFAIILYGSRFHCSGSWPLSKA